MQDKDQNILSLDDSGSRPQTDVVHQPPPLEGASLEQTNGQPFNSQERPIGKAVRPLRRVLLSPYAAIVALLLVTGAAAFFVANRPDEPQGAAQLSVAGRYDSVQIPLNELLEGKDLSLAANSKVTINGILQVSGGLQLGPSLQPTGAQPGQLYYDQQLNQLAYYNGSNFIYLTGTSAGGVQSLGGATGQLALGEGLTLTNNLLTNSGVLSVQGQSGAVTFTAGPGMLINGTTFSNAGVISIASASPNMTVTDDGNGNITLSVTGGTGTVTSSGGAAGTIPMFTATQNIENSIISQAGLAVTVTGDLSVTGNLNLSNTLSVANGGTGSTSLSNNGVLVGQGTSAITSVAAAGAGLCLLSTAGTPAWGVCPGGGGAVTSLDGLNGALTIANSSGAGSTITIDDASTSGKGIASFNASNFSVASGAVNTIQDINSSATPTFAGVNTGTITPTAGLTVGATGQSLLLQGNASTMLTATNGGNSTAVSFQSPTANVTYRFLTTAAGTYDICTTAANCAGVGGGVTTPGGTTNRLAKFGSSQAITDSSITDDGTNVLTSIDMVIQGGDLTIGVPSTQVGTINLAHNGSAFLGSILQGSLSADRTYTLPDASGTFCLTSGNCAGGVTSLNGLVGALSIANASAAGSTITIDDASTSAKGIASFNSTNFSVANGAVNTIQNINTGATPTFAGVNTNTITPSGAMTVGSTSQTALLRGSITTITSSGAGNDIILTSADTIELQGTTNVTGNIDVSGTLTAGTANAFQVAADGTITTAGNISAQGGVVTAGTAAQAGSYVINDGSSNTGTLQVAPLGQNTTYTLPDPGGASATICLTSGNCAGSGGGVTTPGGSTNRLAKFSGAQTIADSTITDNGTTVTTTVDLVIQGGDVTVGTSSQLASLILHDGNGQTTTLQAGDSSGGLTFILPTNAGNASQCLKQSGTGNQLIWDACDGGGGGSSATLQTAYNNGNSITTTDARDIDIVLADTTTDSVFDLVVADNSTGYASFTRANGVGTADPAQLLLIDNLDTDRALPVGVKLQAAGGGMTTAIDATDAEIVDAINVAANNIVGTTGNIDFTNFDVVGSSGDITTAGNLAVNGGTITSAGNINTTGGALQTNSITRVDNSGNLTNIGNLTATGAITIASTGGGNDIVINGADIFDVQDATTFASTIGVNGVATFSNTLTANGDVTIGDAATDLLTITAVLQGGSPLVFEGAAADTSELTLSIATLTGDQTITLPDETGTVCLRNSTNCGFALSSGSNSYIQNQSAIDQSADFRITGTGQVGTGLLSPSLDAASASTLTIAGTNANIINVANNSIAHIVQIATSPAAAQTVTLGSTNAGSTIAIQGGTGSSAVSVQGGTGGTISIGTTSSNTITVGNAATTATLTLGQSTASNTISVGNATTTAGNTQTINIGTSATSTGRALITIGNTNAASALTLQAGTGNLNLLTNSASASVIVKTNTNAVAAFQVQNSSNASVFGVDTVNQRVGINVAAPTATLDLLGSVTVNGVQPATVATNGISAVDNMLTGGKGGNTSGTTGQVGGDGTAWAIFGGNGGDAPAGSTNGAGGAVVIQGGAAGSGAGGGNFRGNVILQEPGGYVGIGTLSPTAFLHLNASDGLNTDLFKITDSTATAADVLTVLDEGAIIARNRTNSTTAFQIQNAASQSLLTVDTSGSNISLLGNNSPNLATWATTTAMSVGANTARVRGGAIAYNGYLYHIGGVDGAGTTLATVQYAKLNADGTVGTWASTTSLLGARRQFQPVIANGYMYVIGGRDGASAQTTAYYAKINNDGTLGAWSSGTPLDVGAAARFAAATVSYGGYIYLIGGFNSSNASQTTVYTIKANADGTLASAWTTTTALSTAVGAINAAVANGYVYLAGGFTSSSDDDIYYAKLNADGTIGSWTTLSGVLNPSGGGDENYQLFVSNGYLYVVGGDLNDRVVAFALNSNGSLGTATPLTDFPLNPMGEAGGATANGYFYILGGSTASDGGGTARNTVYYTGGSRIKVGGGLDLVGYSGENLAEGGSGGQLTAGNTHIVGTLQVQDAASFARDLSVGGSVQVGGGLSVSNIDLPTTTASAGVIKQNGARFIHSFGGATNFFAGTNAGNFTLTGLSNTGVGADSLKNLTTGTDNNAHGVGALEGVTTGNNNTGMGSFALQDNTIGGNNSALGWGSLANSLDGNNNSAFGANALQNNISGSFNVGIGGQALQVNTAGANTAVGNAALLSNTSGEGNVALGYAAGVTEVPANANTTGINNTFIGLNAGLGSTTQLNHSSAIGAHAVVSQSDSLVLGCIGGVNGCSTSTSVGIGISTPATTLHLDRGATTNLLRITNDSTGHTGNDGLGVGLDSSGAGYLLHRDNLPLNIGNNSTIQIYVASTTSNVGIHNTNPGFRLHVGSSAIASGTSVARFENAGGTCTVTPNTAGGITCTSDVRLKKNITDFSGAMEILNQIDVKQYNMLADADGSQKQIGVIAQQLEKVLPGLVQTDKDGYKSVSYSGLSPVLMQAIKEQQLQIGKLQSDAQNALQNGDDAEFGALNVSGHTSLASLTVKGDATFEGKVSVKSITVAHDLSIGEHLISTGTTPRIKALAGGKVRLEGTDAAGTITISSGKELSTELAFVTFRKSYAKTPRIVITATNDAGAKLEVFVEKSPRGFKVRSGTAPLPGATYQYDYIVIQ